MKKYYSIKSIIKSIIIVLRENFDNNDKRIKRETQECILRTSYVFFHLSSPNNNAILVLISAHRCEHEVSTLWFQL